MRSRGDFVPQFAGDLGMTPAADRKSARLKANAVGISLFVVILALLAWRITRGVDFEDESYYAIFIDDWLKGSISSSTFQTLHQTAALIVYPAALAYAHIVGSSDGLFLFLRVLFLTGSVIAALCCTVFLRRLGHGFLAWAAGIFVLSFIPGGLPAPSYNSLGLQALTIALATFGCAALVDRQKEQLGWLAVSASAWAIATVAYPSMIVPLGCFALFALFYRDAGFPRPVLYLTLMAAAICVGWSLVVLSLTPTRLYDSFAFSASTFDSDGWRTRLAFLHDNFAANPAFSILCVFAIGVGVIRRSFPVVGQLATVSTVAMLFVLAPTLYVRSHDAIMLVTLTGLGLLSGLRANAGRIERIIGIVYATSLVAALIFSVSAYKLVWNFPYGALPAAVLAIADRPAARHFNIVSLASMSVGIAAILSTSLFHYYGELTDQPTMPRERMREGFFAGLALAPNDAALIHLMRDRAVPLLDPAQPIALIGRLPGLVLAMPTRLNMPTSFVLQPGASGKVLERYQGYFEQPGRLSTLVLIYQDAYRAPANPISRFSDRYERSVDLTTPLGVLSFFRRR